VVEMFLLGEVGVEILPELPMLAAADPTLTLGVELLHFLQVWM
jgi:hypothetical protein